MNLKYITYVIDATLGLMWFLTSSEESDTIPTEFYDDIIRNDTAHILAEAIKKALSRCEDRNRTNNDIECKTQISMEHLSSIENEMHTIIAQNKNFVRQELSKSDCIKIFAELKEDYKLKIIDGIQDSILSI